MVNPPARGEERQVTARGGRNGGQESLVLFLNGKLYWCVDGLVHSDWDAVHQDSRK